MFRMNKNDQLKKRIRVLPESLSYTINILFEFLLRPTSINH